MRAGARGSPSASRAPAEMWRGRTKGPTRSRLFRHSPFAYAHRARSWSQLAVFVGLSASTLARIAKHRGAQSHRVRHLVAVRSHEAECGQRTTHLLTGRVENDSLFPGSVRHGAASNGRTTSAFGRSCTAGLATGADGAAAGRDRTVGPTTPPLCGQSTACCLDNYQFRSQQRIDCRRDC